jgi:hypothetical protein
MPKSKIVEEDYKRISHALHEADKFIIAGSAWMRQYMNDNVNPFRSRERARAIRASLDLTYALSALRQGRKRHT